MEKIISSVFILLWSCGGFCQISDGQEKLLQTAFKKKDTVLLSQFIHTWQSDTRYDKSKITNDTIRCVYEIFKDMLADTDRRVINLFTAQTDSNKYSIIPSSIKYAIIHELDPDSVILHGIYRSEMADTSKQKSLPIYSRSNDMLFENFYDVYLPDSLFIAFPNFYPENSKGYLYNSKSYERLLADFLSPEYNERRISFLKNAIALPKKIYTESDQKKARLSEINRWELLIDDKQEWAILYRYSDYCVSEILLKKERGKWSYYRWITTICS